uniref:Uncharacterized protein n=1 Tax=Cucumis sativus TaxID=3659 RepID=A0A0A0LD37_CUCSA
MELKVSNFNADKKSFGSVLRSRESMIHSMLFRASTCLVFLSLFFASAYSTPDPEELRLLVSEPTIIQLFRYLPVENSSSSRLGTVTLYERVHIQGLQRFLNLKKVAHTVTVKVSMKSSSSRTSNFYVCFHKNTSLGIGMCPQSQWEKAFEGSWAQFMSPFDHRILDIRTSGLSLETFEVSIEEEFSRYRIIFLILGVVLMSSASILSKLLVFYLGGGWLIRFLLLLLMILSQRMKLLSRRGKNSLQIFLYAYASVGCLGSFFLHYVLDLLNQIVLEMGITISQDMFDPLALATFLIAIILPIGTWLGFWVAHKFVDRENGLIEKNISHFVVSTSIQILATFLILKCSLDPILATGGLICGTMASIMTSNIFKFQLNLLQSPNETSNHLVEYRLRTDLLQHRSSFTHDDDVYPSMFHSTHERRKISKDEWERLTKDSTKKALEELVSSSGFTRWLLDNAGRINIPPLQGVELESVESDSIGSDQLSLSTTDKVSFT